MYSKLQQGIDQVFWTAQKNISNIQKERLKLQGYLLPSQMSGEVIAHSVKLDTYKQEEAEYTDDDEGFDFKKWVVLSHGCGGFAVFEWALRHLQSSLMNQNLNC